MGFRIISVRVSDTIAKLMWSKIRFWMEETPNSDGKMEEFIAGCILLKHFKKEMKYAVRFVVSIHSLSTLQLMLDKLKLCFIFCWLGIFFDAHDYYD